MNQFVDTHCHIHFPDYQLNPEAVLQEAVESGVTRLICVGCSLEDSKSGVEFAKRHQNAWASIGLHPHEASRYVDNHTALQSFRDLAKADKVIAIGEIGLDYYYKHSNPEEQKQILRFQLNMAKEFDLPVIFHVREAFDDFWPIYDEFSPKSRLKGVIHSFTGSKADLEQILKRDLMVGLNGITTFTKNEEQLAVYKSVPLDRLLLETDAPFLTPVPFRGTICQPKHVTVTAAFLSKLRGENLEEIASTTTDNALRLFGL